MGAEGCGDSSPGGGTLDYTQASRPEPVFITGRTSSDAAGCGEAAPPTAVRTMSNETESDMLAEQLPLEVFKINEGVPCSVC